jgi:hypothetical protein
MGAFFALGASAKADDILQFDAPNGASGSVSYDNSSGVVTGSDIPVDVTFLSPNSYGAGSNQVAATFSFSADTSGTAESILGGLIEGVPVVSNVSFSLTADTAVSGDTNILSGTAESGAFSGNSTAFTLSGQNPTDNDGIAYNSDFINVAALDDYSFQFNFENPNAGGGASPGVNGGVLDSFTADLGPGSFAADAVPEPASLGLLGIGALGLCARRRRVMA